jgi:hypothetical protein
MFLLYLGIGKKKNIGLSILLTQMHTIHNSLLQTTQHSKGTEVKVYAYGAKHIQYMSTRLQFTVYIKQTSELLR